MTAPGPGFLYTGAEAAKLKKTIGALPLAQPVGRSLCPFCLHVEARWRSVAVAGDPAAREVRVICSQCQRRMAYAVRC